MKPCTVYRSNHKADTYLFVRDGFDYTEIPEALRKMLGVTENVMTLDLDDRTSLANADINEVKAALQEKGYYLQLPPKQSIEELLAKIGSNG